MSFPVFAFYVLPKYTICLGKGMPFPYSISIF